MKINLLVCTNDEDGQHAAGDVVDFHEAKALEFLEKKWAVRVEEEKPKPEKKVEGKIETASSAGAPENAMSQRGKAKVPDAK